MAVWTGFMEGCVHPVISQLQPIFNELHSSTAATLSSTILKLKHVIEDEGDIFFQSGGSNHSRALYSSLSNWINAQVRELFTRRETQCVGISCVKVLLQTGYIGTNSLTQLFLQLLEDSVKLSDTVVSAKAAELWGLLLEKSGSFAEAVAQSRLSTYISDLHKGEGVASKIAAALFIVQLLKYTPSTVVLSINKLLEGVCVALRDSSVVVMERAADVLRHALPVMYGLLDVCAIREWQDRFLRDSVQNLTSERKEQQCGAILSFIAVLSSVTNTSSPHVSVVNFSAFSIECICEIQQYIKANIAKSTLAPEIRREFMNAVIQLVLYDTAHFRTLLIPAVVDTAATVFREASNRLERPMMFLAIGELAVILRDDVPVFIDRMIPHIEAALVRGPKNDERCLEAVTCFATLAEVDQRAVRPYLRQILALLFSFSPTVGFAKDIARICAVFPELRSTCFSKILNVTKLQLLNAYERLTTGSVDYDAEVNLSLQSLGALRSLNFFGYSTLPFLCDAVINYVSFTHEELRRTAIKLCFELVFSGCLGPQLPCKQTPEGVVIHHGRDHTRLINIVIKKLVNAAVSDPESDIRLHVLESFTEEYDHTLAFQSIVTSLFPALHDKQQNKLAVVRLLGRISRINPAHVYPILRKTMIQCLMEIQHFEHAKKQEQAFSLLGAIVECAPGLCKPYVSSLLSVCVKRLRNSSEFPAVSAALLSCIGKLARYAEGDDIRVVASIRHVVVQHILDCSHLPKKREALRALGDIIRTTKDVKIYEVHPELLSVLLQALHGGFKETWPIRNDVLQLMGIIGAVDPIQVKEILQGSCITDNKTDIAPANAVESEKKIARTVVRGTLRILSLPSLTEEQSLVAMKVIVSVLSLKDVVLDSLVPCHFEIISAILKQAQSHVRRREDILVLLTQLVSCIEDHVRPHFNELTSAIVSFISASDVSVLNQIFTLLKVFRRIFHGEFQPYLSKLLIPILNVLEESPQIICEKVFDFFSAMGFLLEDHLNSVLPLVCEVVVNTSFSKTCRKAAIGTLSSFAQQLSNLSLYAPRCVHSLCRVLKETERVKDETTGSNLGDAAVNALHAIAQNIGGKFENFTPMVFPVVARYYGEMDGKYKHFCKVVLQAINTRGYYTELQRLQDDVKTVDRGEGAGCDGTGGTSGANLLRFGLRGAESFRERLPDSFASLRGFLRKRDGLNDEDWNHWLPRLAVILLRSSPSPLHSCALALAELHDPFARQMLHSAFAACYAEMSEDTLQEVISLLSEVLRAPFVPFEVLQELLNLSEHMERLKIRQSVHGKRSESSSFNFGLFDLPTLMESSEKCNLFAKALHYVEIEFFEIIAEYERSVFQGIPRPLSVEAWKNLLRLCEKSIYLCNLLGQRESANAVLKFIKQNFLKLTGRKDIELSQIMDAKLFDKLQWWSQSCKAYERLLLHEPTVVDNMVGLMRALDNLGSYRRVLEMWKYFSVRVSKDDAAKLAPMGAHAAWLLRRWDEMEHINAFMTDEGYYGTTAVFYKAVLATRKGQFCSADKHIKLCRRRLDSALSALVAESYDRAYDLFVGLQQLCELEELASVVRDKKNVLCWRELWEKRLGSMAYDGWPGTLTNHTLLVPPSQELDMWLSFVSLSHANGRELVSREVLCELLGDQSIESAIANNIPNPATALVAFQHLYETNKKQKAIELLEQYVDKVQRAGIQHTNREREDLAICHARLAEWLNYRKTLDYSAETTKKVLHNLQRATILNSKNGAIWHSWARLHHEAAIQNGSANMTHDVEGHIVSAIEGYLHSARLSQELEDTLGFLSLWFTHGSLPVLQNSLTIKTAINQVSPTVWLKAIPQIIARIYSRNTVIAESVYALMVIIAKTHPQAILYSLNVANTSNQGKWLTDNVERFGATQRVLDRITEFHHNGKAMVKDAALVCRELVRCAVLWSEIWYDELECVVYHWEKNRNVRDVLVRLQPLMEQLQRPETMSESHFVSEFKQLFNEAFEFVKKSDLLGNESYMEEALSLLKTAMKKMFRQNSGMSSLALQLVSPLLLQNGKNLSLVVPGQYKEHGNYPTIAFFQDVLRVMNSKQRPRRIAINGSEGDLYRFLLKGHEDLRLDERVMQLLGFANTILEKHRVTKRRGCLIQTYSVTPLSDNAGLVSWVDHCDTLHQIVKEYRGDSKALNKELNLMQSMCEDLDHLTVIQHVEPFEFALENTKGDDLVRSLWMRAPSAEIWLERRTTYVCSLATMSMVGHVLGLGDRHPANLMIHAFSGRVVHIDFGDCFEVAQHRSLFPEKVPFRLTRMLVKAMEMGGIEGLFRHGCITVMSVLREKGSSLLALLEAFVHDPLVSWWRDGREYDAHKNTQDGATRQSLLMIDSLRGTKKDCGVGSLRLTHASMYCRGAATCAEDNGKMPALQQTRKAQSVVRRIKEKLEGMDFPRGWRGFGDDGFSVEQQVFRLIKEATSNENLCVHYLGWCPFW